MAGAISGGAYTAGVVDFLIQALDSWEAQKANQPTETPAHSVRIRVMSGASAGAMTSAIAAVAFGCEITPVTDVDNPPSPEENRLFDAWVKEIDIMKLLGRRDLDAHRKVMSILDSSELKTIATTALNGRRRATPRRYIDDPLAVLLTVANLRGVPYGFHLFGTKPNTLYGMSNHMDDMRFAVSPTGKSIAGARNLDPATAPKDQWPLLVDAALASGAFPLGLQPRLLKRPHADLDGRLGRKPSWGPPPDPYQFLCVDGGLMNNEPLELARRYLSGGAHEKNPRKGNKAHRAVILIDPFPNQIEFDSEYSADDRMIAVLRDMFTALKNQARFKPEELALAEHNEVYSRFMISPSRQDDQDNPIEPAMAAAILGGFGGFFHESFRRHDFQLGRRNCQAFLLRHFRLPETNPLFTGMSDDLRESHYVRSSDGHKENITTPDGSKVALLPIIPLTGDVIPPVPRPPPPSGLVVDRAALEKAILARARAVGAMLIDSELKAVTGGFIRWTLRQGWRWRLAPRTTKIAMEKIEAELDRL